MINRLYNLIKFSIERFIIGGARNHFLFITILIVFISFSAGILVHIFYPDLSLQDAIWWAFLRLSDPGYLGDDHGLIKRIIATIVTLMGYVIFMGSLVAIMVQLLNSTMKKLESGLTPIAQKNHILILGWTNRTPIIIKEILLSEERVNRFLKRLKKNRLHIVVLTEEVNAQFVHDLKIDLGPLWDHRAIIFRSGNPLKMDHLEKVDYLNASVIIIPGSNFVYGGSEKVDIRNIKLLYSIQKQKQKVNNFHTRILVEIFDPEKIAILSTQYPIDLEILPSNLFISKLVVQTIRHQRLSLIYSEIFSNMGSELYINNYPELEGKDFNSELKYIFPKAIPIGILKHKKDKYLPILNPGGKYTYNKNDFIILLSENLKNTYYNFDSKNVDQKREKIKIEKPKINNKNILIMGWSNKLIPLLSELNKYKDGIYKIDVFSSINMDLSQKILEKHSASFKKIEIKHIEGDSTIRSDYDKLNLKRYDSIILLSNDSLSSGEDSDARTVMQYMFLENLLNKIEHKPHIIIEIMDGDNAELFDKNKCDILISPILISYYLAQMALQQSIGSIYKEIFSSRGAEIQIREPFYYNISEGIHSFQSIQEKIENYGEIAIGILIYKSIQQPELNLNPDLQSNWNLTQKDKIIILS